MHRVFEGACWSVVHDMFVLSRHVFWIKDIINTDGDNEETWEKFDAYFTKLHGDFQKYSI